MDMLQSINPANGEAIAAVPEPYTWNTPTPMQAATSSTTG